MSKRFAALVSILMILALLAGACGGGQQPTPTPAPQAVLAEATPTPVPPTPTPVPTQAPTEEASAFDLTAALNEFASNLPEGWMAVGKLDDVKALIENNIYLVDVREPNEYAEGHIPGAINIPIRTLAQNLNQIPADRPVLIYCKSGHRAGMAVAALRLLGYDNVRGFPGGWNAWSKAGEEVSTESAPAGSFEAKEVNPEMLAAVDAFLSAIPEGFYAIGTVEKLQEAIDNGAVLIDVREDSEVAQGAIPGALHIPLRTLIANLDQIPKDKPLVAYCASGYRSALATALLHILGYENVRAFTPGYGAWEAAQGESGEVPKEVAAALTSDFNILEVADAWVSALPEGFLAVGKLDAFKDILENTQPVLIDVREAEEYAAGHIPGAINIPIRTLTQNLDKIPADRPVFIYCLSGHRAGLALTALGLLGYDNVKSFPPGWKGWSAAGEEVSTEAVEPTLVTPKEVAPEMLAAVEEFLANLPEGYFALGTVEKMVEAVDAGAQPIDVREASEYEQGHIAGAPNIPLRTLVQNLKSIPTDRPVVVYCASGHRAAIATAILHLTGLNNVRSFPPGYGAWEAAGEPVE
ncbi:MAG: rhodanese-like domain-containing protein [Caldilinea sp.]|nr:rhodanese-like domain-containing protein [Caldilinea sp.]MDW8442666.1 rhodanese-like domain-containing protein [Caldilineaceae bacterium]